jgi:hypothetical protein
VQQCSLLIVNGADRAIPYKDALERRGFRVTAVKDWPSDEVVLQAQVVIVVLRELATMCMLAARIRAKPRFGRRILIAVAPTLTIVDRRTAINAGFDDAVPESGGARLLIARILRTLHTRPEHRCFLPELLKRRAA